MFGFFLKKTSKIFLFPGPTALLRPSPPLRISTPFAVSGAPPRPPPTASSWRRSFCTAAQPGTPPPPPAPRQRMPLNQESKWSEEEEGEGTPGGRRTRSSHSRYVTTHAIFLYKFIIVSIFSPDLVFRLFRPRRRPSDSGVLGGPPSQGDEHQVILLLHSCSLLHVFLLLAQGLELGCGKDLSQCFSKA